MTHLYMIQVQLGDLFEDLSVRARNPEEAVSKAKQLVRECADLRVFRNRFTNYVI